MYKPGELVIEVLDVENGAYQIKRFADYKTVLKRGDTIVFEDGTEAGKIFVTANTIEAVNLLTATGANWRDLCIAQFNRDMKLLADLEESNYTEFKKRMENANG